jgi:PPM family protein phosphatase
MTTFVWGAATDVGRVRSGNEDFLSADDGLFLVADGMGGHKAGEVASHLAVEHVRSQVEGRNGGVTTDDLVDAVQEANSVLVERAGNDPELKGMGTTLCALALVRDEGRDLLGVVNVGDSRLYLLKGGELEQITDDHSLVATLERQGRLTRAEAAVHPQRNIVTRALGIDTRVMVDSWEILPFVGDRYLLCSDGLFNEIDDAKIAATLRKLADPSEAAHELVRLANEGGGRDNITCVVVDIVDDTGRDPDMAPDGQRVASKVEGKDRVLAAAHANEPPRSQLGTDDEPARRPKGRGPTWRQILFVVVLFAIVTAAIGSVLFAGTGTYYVGFEGDRVAIFRGQPGGVLWIEPELVERTDLTRQQVPTVLIDDLEDGLERGSVDEAREYVENLQSQVRPPITSPGMAPSPPADNSATTTTVLEGPVRE